MTNKFKPFEMGRRILTEKLSIWERINVDEYQINKPTIFCFGGNTTITPKDANFMCRMAQSLTGIKVKQQQDQLATFDDIDIVGIAYGKQNENDTKSSLSDDELRKLIYNVFVMLFLDKSLNPLPIKQVCRNFSQLTFFSHCHGAKEIYKLLSKLIIEMTKYKYSFKEIATAISQITHISYSPNTLANICPEIKFLSFEDKMHLKIKDCYQDNFEKNLNGVYVGYSQAKTTMQGIAENKYALFDNLEIFSSQLQNSKEGKKYDEHIIGIIERDSNWNLYEYYTGKNLDIVSQMMGYVLARSISVGLQNKFSNTLILKPTLKQLEKELKDILSSYSDQDLQMI